MKQKLLLILFFLGLVSRQELLAQAPPSGFSTTTVSSNWNEAVGLTFNKAGTHMFVWERPGKVWTEANGQRTLLLDISEEVGAWRDLGLLGFALHPQFDTNGYIYLLYTVDRHHLLNYGTSRYNPTYDEYYNATIHRLTRYTATKTADGYTVNPASRKVLIGATKETGIPELHMSHGPGSLVFGADGSLFVSVGDGSSYESADVGSASESYYQQALADGIIPAEQNVGALRAQQIDSYNGKILRIDPETGNGLATNPFYQASAPNAARSKVWALGLRNPFRITLKPGSGSATDPGVLYIGDVGYDTWEEVNVAVRPGMNFGWPLFEGLTKQDLYWAKKTANPYAPTGAAGCTQPYFYFQDLIQQETPTGTATFTNPCGAAVPAGVTTFVHSRPVIDWQHQPTGPARTGTFAGGTASETNIGAPGSPVAGEQFGGSSGVVGTFYPHADFPLEYQNTCFFGDYASSWIRTLSTDANNKPLAVSKFIDEGAIVVSMATHPTETGLYYVNFWPSEIRKVVYNAPMGVAPVAVASADKMYGPGPLTVQFTGSNSRDPEGQPLTYLWDFGDGTTSTLMSPSHTFTAGTPTNYTVTLTVRDNAGSGQTTLVISANNTPPQVTITSPAPGTKYPLTAQTVYDLRANVTDQEHSAAQLTYQWQTVLHHDNHEHPEPVVTSPEAKATISPLGCGSETYYYRILLTVTDALGLATTQEMQLYPDCTSTPTNQIPVANAGPARSITLPTDFATLAGTATDTDGTIARYLWHQVSGPTAASFSDTTAAQTTVSGLVAGSYVFSLKATDNLGAASHPAEVTVTVAPGNGLREPENPASTVAGLAYQYYEGVWNALPAFGTLTATKTGTVPSPVLTPALRDNGYAFQYTGYITVPTDGQYTFYTTSDDGSQLSIGSALVVDNDGLHGDREINGTIGLKAGTHALTITFFENDGGQNLQVSYAGPGLAKQLIPAAAYKRVSSTTVPANQTPVANAGVAANITLPTNSVILNGSGTDEDGTIATYAWTQVSGPSTASFSNAAVAQPTISNLVAGSYVFGLIVTDNQGAISNPSQVTVTVSAAPAGLRIPENPANAVAGLDYQYYEGFWDVLPAFNTLAPVKTGTSTTPVLTVAARDYGYALQYTGYITVPTDGQYTFYTSSDDGSKLYIGSTQVVDNDGGHDFREQSGTIGLKAGTHAFTVSFFQNGGGQNLQVSYAGPGLAKQFIPAAAYKRVSNATTPANQAPVANAGANQSITLPTSTTTLIGSGTDADGTIASYLWAQVSGPNTATFSSKTVAQPMLSSLVAGSYVFSLIVTDNLGAVSQATQVTVAVNAASSLRTPENPTNTVAGLDYKYYEGFWKAVPNFTTLTPTKTGNATAFELTAQQRDYGFAFQFTGYVTVPTDGIYTFATNSDDGSLLYIGNTLVVNNDGTHDSREVSGTIGLKAGTHAFTVAYLQDAGGQNLQVSYTGPGLAKQLIPASALKRISGTANQAPVANAGAAQTITLPTNTVTLNGAGTDADGTIASYLWAQVSGPNTATFSSKTTAAPTISGLVAGPYVFSLIVTDNLGLASAAAQVTITVNAAPSNQAPVANAGAARTITLPTNSVTLAGSGTDADGTVASYAWTQVSGPNTATFTSKTVAQPGVSGLVAGTYVFSLIVTDNLGLASAAAQTTVTVNAANNQVPVANAGAAQTISLPTSSVTLSGSGTDADGTIATYAWNQVSGPNTATFSSKAVATPTVSGLAAGTYVFSLVVTDNLGLASAAAQVSITVNAAPTNQAPVANAGASKTITLPTSSTTLAGSGTDADGTVASYAWTQVSGPNTATFTSKTVAQPGVSGLVAGTYVFSLIVTDNLGLASAAAQTTVTVNAANNLRVPENPVNTVAGLVYNYYEGYWNALPAFGTLTATKIGTVTTPSLTPALRDNGYAFQYTGYITVPTDGQYTFYTTSDDGSQLSIGSTLVVDNDGLHGDQERVGTIGLQAGTHALTITFFENDGGQNLQVSYAGPSLAKQLIPAAAYKRLATSANQAPVANAGANRSITLPVNSVGLSGSATDADGTVAAYLWSQVSGPNTATFSSKAVAQPTVSGLVALLTTKELPAL
jgi:PKD repeat protein/glucose/arabinose dehydrogenase